MAQTLDTAFLKAQDPDQHASLAIGAVAIVAGAAPDHQLLKNLLAERIQSIPRCTQLLRTRPFNQEWIDYPPFELAHHVRRMTIPRPGDETELSRAIAGALERPLDPEVPPWECWVIDGLKGNRWAILLKIHQRLANGNSAAHLLTRLCDDAGNDTFANHTAAEQVSPPPPEKQSRVNTLWRAPSVTGAVTNILTGVIWPAVMRMSPIDPVSTQRRYSTVRVPIADVDRVCRKFGVTADDVALAAITEGFRAALLGRGKDPQPDSLRALMPTAARSAMLSYLPVELGDPIRLLRAVHDRRQAERTDRPQSGGIVESAIDSLPTMLRSSVIQLLSRLPQPDLVTLATHVPGPRHRLQLMGRTMERLLPIPPTAAQLSTGVAVLSYGGELVFGITADNDAAFDVQRLAVGIERGMARLVALSGDSVLLFGKDHRRSRSSRGFATRAPRARLVAREQARH